MIQMLTIIFFCEKEVWLGCQPTDSEMKLIFFQNYLIQISDIVLEQKPAGEEERVGRIVTR